MKPITITALIWLCVATAGTAHPLDSLTADEMRDAISILSSDGIATGGVQISHVRLEPPEKTVVWDWPKGIEAPRIAAVILRRGTDVLEAKVNLTSRTVEGVAEVRGVQTSLTPDDWVRATSLVKKDERWQASIRARGFAEFDTVFCDALSVGASFAPDRGRLVKVPCYDASGTTNVYGRPIEGLLAMVDLDADQVIEVADSGVIATSRADPSLEQERQPTLQAPLAPVISSAPNGANFIIDGELVRWASWSFHLSFDQRVGPIVSTVRHRDGERERPVLFQGHVSEMFVPYMDPDPNWAFRSYMDVGEYGFGSLASPLAEGADCPAGATMLSATLADASGQPYVARNVMCVFERNTSNPLWRRFEVVTGSHEARQDIELVIRTIPTVGNYDYVYDWVFNRKGEIRIDVGATGIVAAKGVEAKAADGLLDLDSGLLVAPNIAAPFHDHFLSFRLDLDVDGMENSVVRSDFGRLSTAGENRSSYWQLTDGVLEREFAAEPTHAPARFRVENSSVRTRLGYAPSFEIVSDHGARSLLSREDPTQKRAAFSANGLWVTRYKPAEMYAAGKFPNQSSGAPGLPEYVDGEDIKEQDLVVWPTMGFHHVTRPEDWPVLLTVQHSLTLRPNRFFDRNPALDVPEEVSAGQPGQ